MSSISANRLSAGRDASYIPGSGQPTPRILRYGDRAAVGSLSEGGYWQMQTTGEGGQVSSGLRNGVWLQTSISSKVFVLQKSSPFVL